ncbi:hypothetical protein HYN69_18330 (plasmid) [Gemmobacter aquarius]|uniref:Uncharacterized protein n=2 Tax=Paragemmobacter aquarius TaxID=2169400 RepID=A0A2S0URZ3_9RHOB|nr:hypothetical protein HYN69_18330 [Gemmobacter aquarius]
MQALAQQVAPLLAHAAALSIPGLAALIYLFERFVLFVPLLLLSITLSHFLYDFSEAKKSGDLSIAQGVVRRQLRFNLIFGTSGGLVSLFLIWIGIFFLPDSFISSDSGLTRFYCYFVSGLMAFTAVLWSIEMIALRALSILDRQFITVFGSVFVALVFLMVSWVFDFYAISALISVPILWCGPLVMRTFLFSGLLLFNFRIERSI